MLYVTLSSSGTMMGKERVWPQYFGVPAILDSNTLNIQPGGDTAKGNLGHGKGSARSFDTLDGLYVLCWKSRDRQNSGHDLLKGPAELESLELELLQFRLGFLWILSVGYCCQ